MGLETLEATIEKVRFRAADSRFCILVMEGGLSALGDMADPLEGEAVRLFGNHSNHDKYGAQFKFQRFERLRPVGNRAIRDYLVKTAKWVGPSVADRMLEKYGDKTLEILKAEPKKVAEEIKGITAARAVEISEMLKAGEKEERIALEMGELCSGRVPDNVVKGAVTLWGNNAPDVVRANPYDLTKIRGCGFAGADRVAAKLEIVGTDPRRLAAALCYVVKLAAQRDGHTRLDQSGAELVAGDLAGCAMSPQGILAALKEDLVSVGDDYALPRYQNAEKEIAGHFERLSGGEKDRAHKATDFGGMAEDQVEATYTVLQNSFSLLVGAPGTGKTWTLARIVAAYMGEGNRIALAAPTGKAAKRMTEMLADTCGGNAVTIHRLLEPIKTSAGFQFSRDANTPIDADVLVVDETSMLDVELAAQLLCAVPDGCKVIFVGDDHQLPSVGPGAVLRDMIRVGVPTARLVEIKRNTGEIVQACHCIKDGKPPGPTDGPLNIEAGHNWRHIEISSPAGIADQVTWLVTEWAAEKKIPAAEVMVVSPFNHVNMRELSCRDFNERLQEALNPPGPGAASVAGGIREKDRVVRLSNGTAEGVEEKWTYPIVNGDIGVVKRILPKHIHVKFGNPDRFVALTRKDANLALAYALSCHKMQGSEARVIVLPLHKSFGSFPSREWIYTAFSRAKEILITVGTIGTLAKWVGRQTNGLRRTGLPSLMKQECKT